MKKIKVSIIVPVYNVAAYLPKCLDSLVNQTLKEIEIIIINDGSLDHSQTIIDSYQQKYPSLIKSYCQTNQGVGAARNYGLTKAHGEYIGFVDSDDYIARNMYEKMYHQAQTNNLDLVVCSYQTISDKGKTKKEPLKLNQTDSKTNAFFYNMAIWNKLYRKKLISSLKFQTDIWYEDLAFNCKAIMQASKIGFSQRAFYNYVERPGSIMNNFKIAKNLDLLIAFDDLLNYLKTNPSLGCYYPQIEYLAIYHIYISAITRVIKIKGGVQSKKIIQELKTYMKEKFPQYRHNCYLKLLAKNKRIVYTIISLNQYWLVKLIFNLKERFK